MTKFVCIYFDRIVLNLELMYLVFLFLVYYYYLIYLTKVFIMYKIV